MLISNLMRPLGHLSTIMQLICIHQSVLLRFKNWNGISSKKQWATLKLNFQHLFLICFAIEKISPLLAIIVNSLDAMAIALQPIKTTNYAMGGVALTVVIWKSQSIQL